MHHHTRIFWASSIALILLVSVCITAAAQSTELFEWTDLPALPRAQSGHFVGVHGGALIVAGGASFPVPQSAGGVKQWHDEVFVLTGETATWTEHESLERIAAYGVMASTSRGVVAIGGSDGVVNHRSGVLLQWVDGALRTEALPDLPRACAMTAAALLDGVLYVAGGQESPDSTEAMTNFWSLDLAQEDAQWQELEPWPGPARILPAVAAQNGSVYVFGGAELNAAEDGTVTRRYLRDGYRYSPASGWSSVAPAPMPITAAPTSPFGQSHIFVFGGDDGALADRIQELGDTHPGFTQDIFAYHTITDTWSTRGRMPAAYVTSAAVMWNGALVIPGGEDRPGHRGARVISAMVQPRAQGFGTLNTFIVIAYFSGLVIMGLYFAGREKSTDDYFLGGKRVPWWAVGLSIFGTQLSAITFIAIPARAYATDWVFIWANVGIVLITPYVVLTVLPAYRKRNFVTAYEYLEERFNVAARLYGAIVFLLFQAGRVGIVLFLPALALNAVTGISVYTCILAMGILATVYTVLGGIEAVIWTDVAQVVVLGLGAVLSLFIIVGALDTSVADAVSAAAEAGKLHAFNWTWDVTMPAVWICLIGNIFAVAYPYTADQTLVQRYLAAKTESAASKAIWMNALMSIPATFIFFALGTSLYIFFKSRPELLDPTLANDAVFPLFIMQQLPAGISGLVIAAIFAAAMSSLDSSLNSVSAVITNDFYGRFRKGLSDRHRLKAARIVTCVFGVFGTAGALAMAKMDIQSIFETYNRLLGLTGGGLAGLLALGVLTRRANGTGALIGALTSAAAVYYVQSQTSIHLFLYGAVGFLTSFFVGYAMSLAVSSGKIRA